MWTHQYQSIPNNFNRQRLRLPIILPKEMSQVHSEIGLLNEIITLGVTKL